MRNFLSTYSLISLLLLMMHLVDIVDLYWVLEGVYWPEILTVNIPLHESTGDRHGLLPTERCGQGETIRLLLLGEDVKMARRSSLVVLEGVTDAHIVQNHLSSFFDFLLAQLSDAFLL